MTADCQKVASHGGSHWFESSAAHSISSQSLDAAEYPELSHLAAHGWTDEPKALAKECTAVRVSKSAPTAKTVIKTLVSLATLAKKPCETFIISDGVGHEETRQRTLKGK
ncbi:MAG TPA: hypothetical protein VGX70_02545 [Gemmataceae bacterium]|nr:hypothetical protein [Gemmataceae bacterium]